MFKQWLVFVLVLMCAVAVQASDREGKQIVTVAEQGVWDGFRGIKWGENIKAVTDMTLEEDSGDGLTVFTRKNDNLTLGTVKLEQVWYGFFKGRFMWAAMVGSASKLRTYETVLEENKQVEAMHGILSARFGTETGKLDPSKPQNIYARISEWKHSDVLVQFSPHGARTSSWQTDKFPQHSYVEITYLPLAREMVKAQESAQVAAEATKKAGIENAANIIQPSKSIWAGFRGIKWGTDINKVPGMEIDEDFGDGLICYTRKEDEGLILSDVQVEKVRYAFYNGHFIWGAMIFPELNDRKTMEQQINTLREILSFRFGKVAYEAPFEWSHGDVSVKYYEQSIYQFTGNKYPGHTYFEATYLPIARQKAKVDEAAQKATDKIKRGKLKGATEDSF